MGQDEIETAVKDVLKSMKSDGSKRHMGEVLKRVFAPDLLGDKPVEKGEVVRIVKQVLAES